MNKTTTILGLIAAFTALANVSIAATIRVPEDHATIQAAIDAASPGDGIVLAAGVYAESGIVIPGTKEGLVLRSEGDVTIQGDDLQTTLTLNASATVEGITFDSGQRGLVISRDVTATIRDCVFRSSKWGVAAIGSRVTVEACSFTDLQSTAVISGPGQWTMTDCTFTENATTGYLVDLRGSSAVVEGCVFRDNAGILINVTLGQFELTDSRFEGNEAQPIRIDGPQWSIEDCLFVDNGRGHVGAVEARCSEAGHITNSLFLDNRGRSSGALLLDVVRGGTTTVEGCTFEGNVAEQGAGAIAYGLLAADGPPTDGTITVTGCTFRGNHGPEAAHLELPVRAPTHGAGVSRCIFVDSTGGPAVRFGPHPDEGVFACNDIFGNAGGDWAGDLEGLSGVDGNLSVDPEFCRDDPAATRDWSLAGTSPLLQACGGIGAWGEGCSATGVEPHTWASIKTRYR